MKTHCRALCAITLFSLAPIYAQNVSKEAGAYERKSITTMNTLLPADGTISSISQKDISAILALLKKGMPMRRFDYNEIPETFVNDFVKELHASTPSTNAPQQDLDNIARIYIDF